MKLAFLYAGQGSQRVGMGKDFYENFPQIREVFDTPVSGVSIKKLCFEGSLEELSCTSNTQPCMAAFAMAVTKLLKERGITPDYSAGLSLGEYNALYSAGVFDESTLLDLLAFRGKVMHETTAGMESKMYAVLGLSDEEAARVTAEAGGNVWAANFNCPGQVVIGGESKAADRAAELLKEAGAKRVLPLNVSGPFHTPLMKKAGELLGEKFESVHFGNMEIPVVFNTTADILQPSENIAQLLVRQVQSPVLFGKSIERLHTFGVDTAVEIGPGKVLSGFVKKTCPEIKTLSIETVEDFEKVINELKGENHEH